MPKEYHFFVAAAAALTGTALVYLVFVSGHGVRQAKLGAVAQTYPPPWPGAQRGPSPKERNLKRRRLSGGSRSS